MMINSIEGIEKKLIQYEEKLLMNEYRNNKDFVTKIINDGCIEISEAGKKIYKSNKDFEAINGVLYITDKTCRSMMLSDDIVLITYEAVKVKKNDRIKANCSSIWKKSDEVWKIIFHQRTLIHTQ